MDKKTNELLEMARQAKAANSNDNAKQYYQKVLDAEPTNWEALFYVNYFTVWTGKVIDTPHTFSSFVSSIDTVVYGIKKNETDPKKIEEDLKQIIDSIKGMPSELNRSIVGNKLVSDSARRQFCCDGIMLYYNLGDAIEKHFNDNQDLVGFLAVLAWKLGAQQHVNWKMAGVSGKVLDAYISKIKKYDPNYVKPKMNAGCITVGKK